MRLAKDYRFSETDQRWLFPHDDVMVCGARGNRRTESGLNSSRGKRRSKRRLYTYRHSPTLSGGVLLLKQPV